MILPMLPGPRSVYMNLWCQGHDVWLPPSVQSLTAEVLEEKLSEFTLTAIAGRMQEWEAKAGLLGLKEADQEVIVKDNISSYNLQKIALMKKWREMCGDQATLRNFLDIAQRNRWAEFRSGMLDDINEAIEKGTGMYEGSAI